MVILMNSATMVNVFLVEKNFCGLMSDIFELTAVKLCKLKAFAALLGGGSDFG
jgi:hypothetical protein